MTDYAVKDKDQRVRLQLPRGDIRLKDGRTLRFLMGPSVLRDFAPNQATGDAILEARTWRNAATGLRVTASIDNTERWGPLLHVSMSYPNRDPQWQEIKLLREVFFPLDIDVAMILPRSEYYVNAHQHCFHLWQAPQMWGIG